MRRPVPRDDAGRMIDRVLTPEALADHRGLLGHHHVSAAKHDPGPAFDWETVLRASRR
ncbi:MAG: hypothetical protein AAFX76_12415 [Planctomycetota bacterium]